MGTSEIPAWNPDRCFQAVLLFGILQGMQQEFARHDERLEAAPLSLLKHAIPIDWRQVQRLANKALHVGQRSPEVGHAGTAWLTRSLSSACAAFSTGWLVTRPDRT